MVLADTVRPPGAGSGVIRVHGTEKLLAFTSDVTPRYVVADPFEGGKQAVAEAWRNLVATGATPLAATDNLNFGNPEKPEIMGQFVGAVRGIGEACRALEVADRLWQRLALQRDGRPADPADPDHRRRGRHADGGRADRLHPLPGDVAILIGGDGTHLGQSALLAELLGRAEGSPPAVDLVAEERHGAFLHRHRGFVRAAVDLSDGGLALAAFELAHAAACGFALETEDVAALFGEDQARYLIAAAPEAASALEAAGDADGVPISRVGTFGGDIVRLGRQEAPLPELAHLYRTAFEAAIR